MYFCLKKIILQKEYDTHFATVQQIPLCTSKSCVYPGDADHDGIVNCYDLMYINVPNGTTGIARTDQTTNWQPLYSTPWTQAFPLGLNYKYSDVNGDGKVTDADYTAAFLNYDFQRFNYQLPEDKFTNGNAFKWKLPVGLDTLHSPRGKGWYVLKVNIDSIPDLYTAAFQVEYDQRYFYNIEPIAQLALSKLTNQHKNKEKNTIDAVFKLNKPSSAGLLSLQIKAAPSSDESWAKQTLPSPCTKIRIKNIVAMRKNGSIIPNVGSQDLTFCFDNATVATEDVETKDNPITVFPNPFEHTFFIKNNTSQCIDIQLFNTLGLLIKKQTIAPNETIENTMQGLASGMYFLKSSDGKRTWVEKIVCRFGF
ncbi:MAG: hypothetical protein RLZZ292_176 [Bacteroidota bacterium]